MYLGMLTAELGDSREAFCNVIIQQWKFPFFQVPLFSQKKWKSLKSHC